MKISKEISIEFKSEDDGDSYRLVADDNSVAIYNRDNEQRVCLAISIHELQHIVQTASHEMLQVTTEDSE